MKGAQGGQALGGCYDIFIDDRVWSRMFRYVCCGKKTVSKRARPSGFGSLILRDNWANIMAAVALVPWGSLATMKLSMQDARFVIFRKNKFHIPVRGGETWMVWLSAGLILNQNNRCYHNLRLWRCGFENQYKHEYCHGEMTKMKDRIERLRGKYLSVPVGKILNTARIRENMV